MAWQVLCGAHDSSDKSKYSAYLRTQSACEKVIRRDIARTYPEHDFFKKKGGVGQESLFNVMKAYSTHDREVGYCQGSAFIVGLLLMEVRLPLLIAFTTTSGLIKTLKSWVKFPIGSHPSLPPRIIQKCSHYRIFLLPHSDQIRTYLNLRRY